MKLSRLVARRPIRTALAACGILVATGSSSWADYPDRLIHILMPFPPGGAVDAVMRVVTEPMAAHLGKQFVIENKSGAGGVIATDAAAKAAPDGTPKEIIDKLASAVARAVREPRTIERLRKDGVDAVGGTPEEFRQQIALEITQWRDVGRSSNIKLEQ